MRSINVVIFILTLLLTVSCRHNVQMDQPDFSSERLKKKEALIKLNKYIALRNQDLILSFVERTGWQMKNTGTGLWFEIISAGNGKPVSENSIVTYSYKVHLLDGTFCDSTSSVNLQAIKIGHGGVESGLEEALLLLREGDHARFIIPPHLAHGNFGNGSKIPPGAIIIYEIALLKVSQ